MIWQIFNHVKVKNQLKITAKEIRLDIARIKFHKIWRKWEDISHVVCLVPT